MRDEISVYDFLVYLQNTYPERPGLLSEDAKYYICNNDNLSSSFDVDYEDYIEPTEKYFFVELPHTSYTFMIEDHQDAFSSRIRYLIR